MKIEPNTVKELPVGTFFRHTQEAIFVVIKPITAKCIFTDGKSYLKKDMAYGISFDRDIHILEGEELENAKVELL